MKTIKFLLIILSFISVVQLSATDYYWVGGTGKWSDLNSWRTSSGDIPNEVPDDSDNVIFNANSFSFPFDTVFILTGNPTCKNMTWENIQDTVVIWGGSTTSVFSIYGSVQLQPNVLNYYFGKISFLSDTEDNTIACNGSRFAGDIWFDGTGKYTLMDTLFVLDTIKGWEYVIDSFVEPIYPQEFNPPNPIIIQNKGNLDANGQTIISRGLSTNGGNSRTLDIENSTILMNGNWTLNAEDLDFNAANSYFRFSNGSVMNNLSGDVIQYNDIDFNPLDGAIKNTNIRTIHRKVHFLGSGTIDGKLAAGLEGSFTIDTLIFEGAIDPMTGPIEVKVAGPFNYIHFTSVGLVPGYFDQVKWGEFGRIEFNGGYDWGPSLFNGQENDVGTMIFSDEEGYVAGPFNHVSDSLYFNKKGVVSAYSDVDTVHGTYNKIKFCSDGYMLGSNIIDSLIMNSGYWYRMSCDSLDNGFPIQKYQQEVGYMEVAGGCTGGLARLTSTKKEVIANLAYNGNSLPTEYIYVKDINNNAGNIVFIDNGIDGGNNNGFDFSNELQSRTLYWVGGTGNWSDMAHWSLAPGGTGGECPPTIRDDVYFNGLSGFTNADTVNIDQKHAGVNDLMWEPVQGRPLVTGTDTSSLHIWGSVKLEKSMTFLYPGEVYFESENDEFYETIDMRNKIMLDDGLFEINHFFNKVFFSGKGGKWKLAEETKIANYADTTFLVEGELMLDNNEMDLMNFQADDTLTKGLYLLGESVVTLHQYQATAWNMRAYKVDEKTFFDAGHSTIIAYGDLKPGPVPDGLCNIRSWGEELEYYNIEFNYLDSLLKGAGSLLMSEAKNKFHHVDFHIYDGKAVGSGIIDVLTFHKDLDVNGDLVMSADRCRLENSYEVNYIYAESDKDTIVNNHIINNLYFKGNDGGLVGGNQVNYLQANKTVMIKQFNTIGEALLYGNAFIFGTNVFDKLTISPNKRYTFQHWVEGAFPEKFQTVNNDFIIQGNCDEPIRMNSDSIGTEARILYKALNPTHPDEFSKYTSIKDITMIPYENKEYIANDCINLGNNSNITFTETNNDVYYWIGGTGDWGDWSHWSNVSGGMPLSDQCTPREINTVVFDDNSFNNFNDTVKIDVLNAYCKNMWWVNSENYKPTFYGGDSTVVYIYGSMQLSNSLDYGYKGHLFFDQLVEPGDLPDTLTTRGHIITSTIRFQGIDDVVLLGDDLTTVDPSPTPPIEVPVYHEHGTLDLNGFHMRVFNYESNYRNPRSLILDNSKMSVYRTSALDTTGRFRRAFWLNGENLDLSSDNSEIIIEATSTAMLIKNGENLKFNNITVNGSSDSIANWNNSVEYNVVKLGGLGGLMTTIDTGYYITDSVLMDGNNSYIFNSSSSNFVELNGTNCGVQGQHDIKRCYVNKRGYITSIPVPGKSGNEIEKCIFKADGYFRGENVFDTLVMYPGEGNFQNLGNKFTFEANKTQYIMDSLNVRGNQCSNITIQSNGNSLAYLKVVNSLGSDISCDYLYIRNVAAESDTAVVFYAGINSTALPNPNDPPPGWIFDNAQGYIFGFDGRTERFCYGDDYLIKTSSFNGGPSTLFFWEGSSVPGGNSYRTNEPGTYHVRVEYFEGCYVDDYIKLEADLPPDAWIEPGPYCEGDLIPVYVSPDKDNYKYTWSTGDSTQNVRATLAMNDGGIFATVLDTTNGCKTTPEQMVYVKPTPDPEPYLGPDVAIKFGQTVTIDAGPGDTWQWSSNPAGLIDPNSGQIVTVAGNPDTVTYIVTVTTDGCDSTGYKKVYMYPPSKLGIPTAFSPNGDGSNDVFEIHGSGFAEMDFKLFDRYGKLVWHTTDPTDSWDGTVNGLKQEQEVYTYYIRVVFQDKEVREETGNITLLR